MLILASASPRRKEILESHGVGLSVVIPHINESSFVAVWEAGGKGDVGRLVMDLAYAKAQDVLSQITAGAEGFRATADLQGTQLQEVRILAADTIVFDTHNQRILGKPDTPELAVEMLMGLSGKSHEVYTGVALLGASSAERVFFDCSTVTFDSYDEATARAYVKTREPLDKAGAYAIQGLWGKHVTSIEGDFENIVGLPWHRIAAIL